MMTSANSRPLPIAEKVPYPPSDTPGRWLDAVLAAVLPHGQAQDQVAVIWERCPG
jgi:hypothetical protein